MSFRDLFAFQPSFSLNDLIDSDDFPCNFYTSRPLEAIIESLPPGCEGALIDFPGAYRTIPNVPDERPSQTVRIDFPDGSIEPWVDMNGNFGLASAGGAWGHVADAIVFILRTALWCMVLNWVDDFVFIRQPFESTEMARAMRLRLPGLLDSSDRPPLAPTSSISSQPPSLAQGPYLLHLFAFTPFDVRRIISNLGLSLSESKTMDFAAFVRYVGFLWFLRQMRVEVPEDKVSKYIDYLVD